MIEVKGLKKSIRNGARVVEILRGIDLMIPKGQFAAIMGASGSGKSTLLGLLAGLDSPSEGEVILDGIAISKLEEDKLAEVRGQRIGFVFQSYQLIPTLTALENVMLPYELNARGTRERKRRRCWRPLDCRTGCIIIRCSCRGVSSNGWRWRGRSCWSRRLCWPMSRRGIWIRRTGSMCWNC